MEKKNILRVSGPDAMPMYVTEDIWNAIKGDSCFLKRWLDLRKKLDDIPYLKYEENEEYDLFFPSAKEPRVKAIGWPGSHRIDIKVCDETGHDCLKVSFDLYKATATEIAQSITQLQFEETSKRLQHAVERAEKEQKNAEAVCEQDKAKDVLRKDIEELRNRADKIESDLKSLSSSFIVFVLSEGLKLSEYDTRLKKLEEEDDETE